MKIQKLTLRNFRKFDDITEKFLNVNDITGRNGSGKTTVKEAILFCLYGRDNSGNLRANDSLIKTGQVIAEVEVEFEDYTLKRVKNANASKIFHKDDGSQWEGVAQRDLDSMIPKHNLFASIFDVGYFHTLAEKEQRQIIVENSPAVDRMKLLQELHPGYDEKAKEWGLNLDEGYGTARIKVMQKLKDINNDIQLENRTIEYVYTDEEVKAQQELVDKAKEELEKVEDKGVCGECGQELPGYNQARFNLSVAESKLKIMHEVDMKQRNRKKQIKEDIKKKQDSMFELQVMADILAPKGMPAVEFGIKVKPIVKYLDTLLPGIEIETVRYVKSNNTWEEAFIIKYNGIEFPRLSTGEQKKVALAFSEMLDKISGYQVGVKFVDHMECITGKLPKVDSQLILAKVTESDYKFEARKE